MARNKYNYQMYSAYYYWTKSLLASCFSLTWVIMHLWPNGKLIPPTRTYQSHHSEQQVPQNRMFGKLSSLSITTYSTGILTCHPLPNIRTFYLKVQIHIYVLKRCFAPPVYVQRDLFTTPIGVKHQNDNRYHTFPGIYSPASSSSASVIRTSYSKSP